MKCAGFILLIIVIGGTWRVGRATCVLESDFGFILNCAFKKSGLFRVRNLGGIKAHASLGFSVGDELGFKESISNTELNRRRSVQASKFQVAAIQAQQTNSQNNAKLHMSQSSVKSATASQSRKDPVTIPPFKPIPPAQERPVVPTVIAINSSRVIRPNNVPTATYMGVAVPSYNAMPSSISRLSNGATIAIDKNKGSVGVIMPIPKNKLQAAEKMSSQNFAIRTLPTKGIDISAPIPQQSSNSIQSLLAATNISEAAFEAAILQRQQMLQSSSTSSSSSTTTTSTTTTTTTTSTTPKVPSKFANIGKVMNAPKEYYPVGYDKNFDDNFASRVELPDTSFYCGDQKHFPGLYADEDLGCMVFHVCALTDDGLIMKSFLCPESTLFDQSILKCNWWFYVDCKNSKKIYDSNIPVSKSYQLMKALTFFSSYKKDSTTKSNEKD